MNSPSGSVCVPLTLSSSTLASSASSAGTPSAAGEALQRLPAMVPAFCVWMPPMSPAAPLSASNQARDWHWARPEGSPKVTNRGRDGASCGVKRRARMLVTLALRVRQVAEDHFGDMVGALEQGAPRTQIASENSRQGVIVRQV